MVVVINVHGGTAAKDARVALSVMKGAFGRYLGEEADDIEEEEGSGPEAGPSTAV